MIEKADRFRMGHVRRSGILSTGPGDEWATWGREFIAKYVDPRRVIAVGAKRLALWLKKQGDRDAERRAQNLIHAAEEAVDLLAADELVATLREQVRDELRAIEHTWKRFRDLEHRIESVARSLPVTAVLRQIKGVGLITACTFVAKIEDPRRFSSAKKLRSNCGLVPGRNQSGKRDPQGLRITKAGDHELRRVLYLAAWSARLHEPDMRVFADRLDARGKHYAASTTAAAAKIAVWMRSLWLRFLSVGEDPAKVQWHRSARREGADGNKYDQPRSGPSGDAPGRSTEPAALSQILPAVAAKLEPRPCRLRWRTCQETVDNRDAVREQRTHMRA